MAKVQHIMCNLLFCDAHNLMHAVLQIKLPFDKYLKSLVPKPYKYII